MPRETLHSTPDQNDGTSSAWMITFADLLSLILTFFVLLLSMSSLENDRWGEISKSLSQRLNPDKTAVISHPSQDLSIRKVETKKGLDIEYLYGVLAAKVEKIPGYNEILQIQLLEDRIAISLSADATFATGQAILTPEAETVLADLSNVLNAVKNIIDVVGHTDPSPVNTPDFPSNWELSLSRALQVTDTLHRYGYIKPIRSFGRAHTTYETLTPEKTPKERYDFSRRVDIIVRMEETGL